MLLAEPDSGFATSVLFTTGEAIGGYRPPGVMDGIVGLPAAGGSGIALFVTHELEAGEGYPYRLANGTELTGSRITRFEVDRLSRRITGARLAYRQIRDRAGRAVTDPGQLNQGRGGAVAGLESFCSAAGWTAGQYGFVDDLVMAHEEVTRSEGHPHGGTIFALDVAGETLWALPALGRGSWENSAALVTPDGDRPDGHVALLLGDDLEFGGAPLYLWIGRKVPGGNFVERNGLASGQLHVWVAANGDRTPGQWSGTSTVRDGRFVPVPVRSPDGMAGPGTDAAGYYDDPDLRRLAGAAGAFMFSRPEDVHVDPADGTRAVFAVTGHGAVFPEDDWGNVYLLDLRFTAGTAGSPGAEATLRLLYDGDDTGDRGLRNPDNLVWARDGRIYVQEDRATKRGRFGRESGREASIWALDPAGQAAPERIAVINRRAVPVGSRDGKVLELGAWESSGVADVSALLGAAPGELLLLANVQAHGVTDGRIGGRDDLVEASQLLLLSRAKVEGRQPPVGELVRD